MHCRKGHKLTQTLVIASRKGGAGKSTLAMHLSVLAEAGGSRVLLVDTDPQGSLARWYERRGSKTPELLACEPSKLAGVVKRAGYQGYAYCIVDTPPHAEGSILDAMAVADLILVPTRPGIIDLDAVVATLDLADAVKKTPLVVLNHTPPSAFGWTEASLVTEAREAVQGMGAEVCTAYITQRIALAHALTVGMTVGEYEPTGKAAKEVAALWREIHPRLNPEMEIDTNGNAGAQKIAGDFVPEKNRKRRAS